MPHLGGMVIYIVIVISKFPNFQFFPTHDIYYDKRSLKLMITTEYLQLYSYNSGILGKKNTIPPP